jgi:2-polyprenyl-3-methyl-5-hydroxy-6-metoxy-1,4-benzoquinol methylase
MASSVSEIQDRESLRTNQETGAAVNCPVCASQCSGSALYRYTVEQAAAHFCPATRDIDRNRRLQHCIAALWQRNDCEILRCAQCGFAFGYPFIGGNEEFYSILHEQKDYPGWRWDYEVAISEAIENFECGKILDVGAGAGMFLRHLDSDWGRYAVEGSETTRRELEAAGIEVFRDLSAAARSHADTFQVVTLFQVLEHIAEFHTLLTRCRELLVTGGRLVVTVPDGDAMIRQEKITGCHDMPPNHINKWTPESLSCLLRRMGFECGRPIYEPSSWKNFRASLHMRVGADATHERSLAGQVYRIRSRPVRIAALSLLAIPALVRMLPYGRQLRLGGAFAMIGVAEPRRASGTIAIARSSRVGAMCRYRS